MADTGSSRIRVINSAFTQVSSLEFVVNLQSPKRLVFNSNFQTLIISSSDGLFGSQSHRLTEVRISDSSVVKTLGNGATGHMDGIGGRSRFQMPTALAWTSEGALLVGDAGSGSIRMVNWATSEVSTLVFPDEAHPHQLNGMGRARMKKKEK